MQITRELATRVRNVVDVGLVKGLGTPEPGKMCVEAAVCYAMGLPHSDEPSCVSSAIRSVKITLNDSAWSSTQTRAKGMRRLAIAQLGSAGVINDVEFSKRLAVLCVKTVVTMALKKASEVQVGKHKEELERLSIICSQVATTETASWAANVASAASETGSDAASWAARAASEAGRLAAIAASVASARSEAANGAASAAIWAASAASWAARAANGAASATSETASDKILSDFAEDIVQLLVEMEAPGCEFLDLVPLNE